MAFIHRRRFWYAVAAAFLVLSFFDALSTVVVIASLPGGAAHERNPLMAVLLASPVGFAVVKMGAAWFIAWRFADAERVYAGRPWLLAVAAGMTFWVLALMTLVFANNLLVLSASPWRFVTFEACQAMIVVLVAWATCMLIHRAVIDAGRFVRARVSAGR